VATSEYLQESLNASSIQTLQKEVANLKKHTKMMSFLTENAFNYAKSKSISNMPVEPKETDYTESLAQLLSDKILAQMYGELK
jgi:hypothetical protein